MSLDLDVENKACSTLHSAKASGLCFSFGFFPLSVIFVTPSIQLTMYPFVIPSFFLLGEQIVGLFPPIKEFDTRQAPQ